MKPFVIVIGPAQHGKSTVRRRLASVLGVKGASCSDHLYSLWSIFDGYRGPEMLKELPKEEVRSKLVKLGNWITSWGDLSQGFPFEEFPNANPDHFSHLIGRRHPAALIQAAYRNGVRVLDGVRRQCEVDAALPQFAWFGAKPIFIWVEDPRKEHIAADNLDIRPNLADHFIFNDGSLEELDEKIFSIAREILRVSDSDA